MERREFFKSLIAGGATARIRPERRNERKHHTGEIMYRGPLTIPERVSAIVAEHPGLCRTTSRHLVMRYVDRGTVYLFRARVPEHRAMVGEIVRTFTGALRVHAWSAADPVEDWPEWLKETDRADIRQRRYWQLAYKALRAGGLTETEAHQAAFTRAREFQKVAA